MPSVVVKSFTFATRRAERRSTATPSAIFGATEGSTCAVQPVVVSPSIARLGSPKLLAGYEYGSYVEAALVSSSSAGGSFALEPPVVVGVVVVVVGVVVVFVGVVVVFVGVVVPVLAGAVALGGADVTFGVACLSGILGGFASAPRPGALLGGVAVPGSAPAPRV